MADVPDQPEPIRVVIVDDEPLARERVREFLDEVSDVQVVGEAANGREAVRIIEIQAPDLVVLDVQMPEGDGFSVVEALTSPPHIIFATAFDEYALRAFDVEALDYLLKPFTEDRLLEALERVRRRIRSGAAPIDPRGATRAAGRPTYARHIPVSSARTITVLGVDEILYFGAEDRLVFAHVEGRSYLANFTLRELEERLDPEIFFRCHKSRIVNIDYVRQIRPAESGTYRLVLRDEAATEVELSRTQARALRERLGF